MQTFAVCTVFFYCHLAVVSREDSVGFDLDFFPDRKCTQVLRTWLELYRHVIGRGLHVTEAHPEHNTQTLISALPGFGCCSSSRSRISMIMTERTACFDDTIEMSAPRKSSLPVIAVDYCLTTAFVFDPPPRSCHHRASQEAEAQTETETAQRSGSCVGVGSLFPYLVASRCVEKHHGVHCSRDPPGLCAARSLPYATRGR